MISRRSFLTALSCLPFVGKWVPRSKIVHLPDRWAVVNPDFKVRIRDEWNDGPELTPEMREAFKVAARNMASRADYDLMQKFYPNPNYTFAEWDRKYQG